MRTHESTWDGFAFSGKPAPRDMILRRNSARTSAAGGFAGLAEVLRWITGSSGE